MKINAADTIIEVSGIKIGPSLTKEQAEKLYEFGQEAVVFVLTTQAKMIAQQMANSAQSPAAPSSAKPVYQKENKLKKKRGKKIGAKKGHVGSRPHTLLPLLSVVLRFQFHHRHHQVEVAEAEAAVVRYRLMARVV